MDSISHARLALGALVLAVLIVLLRVHRSPTSKLPGPWYTKWTSLVLKYHWIKGQRAFYVHRLHQQYGPCVRVAPNEVHFTDIAAVKTIYNTRESFPKSPWYMSFATGKIENIFSTRNVNLHRRYRRLLSGAISESALVHHFEAVRSKADHAVSRMAEEMKSRGAADISKWWLFMASDIIGELSFGESFHALEEGKKTEYLHNVEQLVPLAAIRTTFPAIIPLGMKLKIPMFVRAGQAAPRIRAYAHQSLELYDQIRQADASKVRQTLFTKVFEASETGNLSLEEIVSNAQGYIIAGTDTTASTLTYLVWSVCRHSEIQQALVEELNTLATPLEDSILKELPLLNHLINETLRLYAAIPSALPREVPHGGAELAGYWLPEGTTVCSQAYSMHRDPTIWQEAEKFDPGRWENPTKAMQDAFMPFGAGARVCIGLNLARMELRYAAAKFFLTFPTADVSSREGMSDDDMRRKIWFLQASIGGRCLIESK